MLNFWVGPFGKMFWLTRDYVTSSVNDLKLSDRMVSDTKLEKVLSITISEVSQFLVGWSLHMK